MDLLDDNEYVLKILIINGVPCIGYKIYMNIYTNQWYTNKLFHKREMGVLFESMYNFNLIDEFIDLILAYCGTEVFLNIKTGDNPIHIMNNIFDLRIYFDRTKYTKFNIMSHATIFPKNDSKYIKIFKKNDMDGVLRDCCLDWSIIKCYMKYYDIGLKLVSPDKYPLNVTYKDYVTFGTNSSCPIIITSSIHPKLVRDYVYIEESVTNSENLEWERVVLLLYNKDLYHLFLATNFILDNIFDDNEDHQQSKCVSTGCHKCLIL